MNPSLKPLVESFIQEEQLPKEYFNTVERWFLPMVDEMLHRISAHHGTYIVGISGCQGSGKSTLASLLVLMLKKIVGLRCINLSIDDFYLTHDERLALANEVHPLLATRGVPGTHDVELAINIISALKGSEEVAIPRFDKAADDRLSMDNWPKVLAPMDVIVLEGWCLGVGDQPDDMLAEPVNILEATEDRDGSWRRYVNESIRNHYGALYDLVDFLVMLKAPAFENVFEWRQTQEDKLAEKSQAEGIAEDQINRIMTYSELQRFIQHYERVSRYGLDSLPEKADVVFQLNDSQTIDKRL